MDVNENTSLLPSDPDDATVAVSEPRQRHFIFGIGVSRGFILVVLFFWVILLGLGAEFINPAQTRVLEQIFCRDYYQEHDPSLIGSDGKDGVDEKWCKVQWVQGEVALLKGWQLFLDGIGMLVFSMPWAHIADLYGRRPVILILSIGLLVKYAYVQLICSFSGTIPLKFTWISAIHTLCGGSFTVGAALTYTIISDIVPQSERVSIFFQVMAANISTQFLGLLGSAALMTWDPWIPMLLGLAIVFAGVVTLFLLPETLDYRGAHQPTPSSTTPQEEDERENEDHHRINHESVLQQARQAVNFLISDIRILLLVPAFSVHMLFLNRDILFQYISTRYMISLAGATSLVAIRSGLILILCVVVLPILNVYCRRQLGSSYSDLLLSRTSACILSVSFLGVGLAPSLPFLIFALVLNSIGWGLFSFVRSLLIDLVEPHHVARLNSWIGVFDTAGLMVGSPMLAALFRRGIELGGAWSGLPFCFCAAVVAAIALMLTLVSVSELETEL